MDLIKYKIIVMVIGLIIGGFSFYRDQIKQFFTKKNQE